MNSSDEVSRAAAHAEAIRAHVERNIGKIIAVFPESSQDEHTMSVLHVGPSEGRPLHTLITSGMSDRPMPVPAGEPTAPRYLELMMTLPEHWQLDPKARAAANWNWPIVELLRLARLPSATGAWLGWGHIVTHGTPPQPFAPNTSLCGVIVAPSLLVKQAFYELDLWNRKVAFFSAIPLYKEELALGEEQGMQVLLSKLLDRGIKDVVDPARKNVAKKRFGLF